jgi:hypothetical protein
MYRENFAKANILSGSARQKAGKQKYLSYFDTFFVRFRTISYFAFVFCLA